MFANILKSSRSSDSGRPANWHVNDVLIFCYSNLFKTSSKKTRSAQIRWPQLYPIQAIDKIIHNYSAVHYNLRGRCNYNYLYNILYFSYTSLRTAAATAALLISAPMFNIISRHCGRCAKVNIVLLRMRGAYSTCYNTRVLLLFSLSFPTDEKKYILYYIKRMPYTRVLRSTCIH